MRQQIVDLRPHCAYLVLQASRYKRLVLAIRQTSAMNLNALEMNLCTCKGSIQQPLAIHVLKSDKVLPAVL